MDSIEKQMTDELDKVLREESEAIEATRTADLAHREARQREAAVGEQARRLRMSLYVLRGERKDEAAANEENNKRRKELKRPNLPLGA